MKIQQIDLRSSDAAQQLVKSFQETGFAIINNHSIDSSLIDRVYEEWKLFFEAMTLDEKNEYHHTDGTDGYYPMNSENARDSQIKDLKEFFHYYGSNRQNLPNHIMNTNALYRQLNNVGQLLLSYVQGATPKEVRDRFSYVLPAMASGSPNTLLRIIHYPPIDNKQTARAVRAAAHEDINLITLLPTATAAGLQVKDVNGNWRDVIEDDPNSIVVNVGDTLQMASGGYYKSTSHRVINPEDLTQSRYSMPMFIHSHSHIELRPGYTAGQYLRERLVEIGIIDAD
jgi:isopenicillin N synthase-like dioxygenase